MLLCDGNDNEMLCGKRFVVFFFYYLFYLKGYIIKVMMSPISVRPREHVLLYSNVTCADGVLYFRLCRYTAAVES